MLTETSVKFFSDEPKDIKISFHLSNTEIETTCHCAITMVPVSRPTEGGFGIWEVHRL